MGMLSRETGGNGKGTSSTPGLFDFGTQGMLDWARYGWAKWRVMPNTAGNSCRSRHMRRGRPRGDARHGLERRCTRSVRADFGDLRPGAGAVVIDFTFCVPCLSFLARELYGTEN